jgi:hypothetical protein
MIRSRTGAYRMQYSVAPGLYAVGEPDGNSEVFVTANYKLSFDVLRRELKDLNAWVLVLDTKSINVWCAAGKGTFATDELVSRMAAVRLADVIAHRRLILPQFGAVGVNAAAVGKRTGFRVYFGPVRARDIPAYLRAQYKKTPEMSSAEFTMLDRLVLTPMELNPALRKFPLFAGVVLLIFGLQPEGILFGKAWEDGRLFLLLGLLSVLSGAFVTPLLLPWIPFRSFAAKGWLIGAGMVALMERAAGFQPGIIKWVAYLFFPALTSYVALQFTGSTTFTGMSGVKREMKFAVPAYIAAAAISAVLMIIYKIREWGLL